MKSKRRNKADPANAWVYASESAWLSSPHPPYTLFPPVEFGFEPSPPSDTEDEPTLVELLDSLLEEEPAEEVPGVPDLTEGPTEFPQVGLSE